VVFSPAAVGSAPVAEWTDAGSPQAFPPRCSHALSSSPSRFHAGHGHRAVYDTEDGRPACHRGQAQRRHRPCGGSRNTYRALFGPAIVSVRLGRSAGSRGRRPQLSQERVDRRSAGCRVDHATRLAGHGVCVAASQGFTGSTEAGGGITATQGPTRRNPSGSAGRAGFTVIRPSPDGLGHGPRRGWCD